MNDLQEKLEQLARSPVLLVGTDYDGTLAEIVAQPSEAQPHREAMVAVRALASMPQTHVAIISGRSLEDLASLTGEPTNVHLVGSHGSEFDPDFATRLTDEQMRLQSAINRDLHEIASRDPGFLVETKPAGAAFHYRNASDEVVPDAVQAVLDGPAARPGVHTRHGKLVVELSVVGTNKGGALETLRNRVGATAALFMGDDRTDEDAFLTLSGPDVAIKIGPGDSAAPHRVDDPMDVARLLASLTELRQAWLTDSNAVPIEEHAMLSDQRTVALLTTEARINWFCAPRVDSPALFAELLGGPTAGVFAVAAADGSKPLRQSYRPGSMIVETRWKNFSVTDYLDASLGRAVQRAGRCELVRVLSGSGRVKLTFAPRLDFGRVDTELHPRSEGLVIEGSFDPIVLRSPGVEWTIENEGRHQTATAEVELGPRGLALELRYGVGDLEEGPRPEFERRRLTHALWNDWAEQLELPELNRDLVLRSALTLRALCHGPTGAIVAAATTSLPEHLGGVRNWDYRYCWLRDAAQSAEALVRLGSLSEAMRFLDWVLGVVGTLPGPERLRPLYLVTGGELGAEGEIGELSGYGGSRPVRVGNAAAAQVQLDVFGPVVQLIQTLSENGAPLSTEHWRLVEALVAAVEARWQEPDHGIWEIRGPRRQHVHSKVMCWITVDRAMSISRRFLGIEREDWADLRKAISDDVLSNGWNEQRGAFTAAYGAEDLDAAVLFVGLSGMLPGDDPRFVATVETIDRELREGPIVYRYREDDGLPGVEGGFLLCASWLVDSLILVGEIDRAQQLFRQLCGLAGPTGLLPEEFDPSTGIALGNHPQAYSHLGVIHNALNLERASR